MKLKNLISMERGLPRLVFAVLATLTASTAIMQAQSPLDTIRTPEKAVATVNQSLEGTWLFELRPAGQTAILLHLETYLPNGTVIGVNANGAQTTGHGIWIRVGDRKFLQTGFVFSFNESRVFAAMSKVRVNVQLSLDGQTLKGTQEVVLMDPAGKVTATIPGGTFSGVRLSPEIPGDFYDFQKLP